jgi:hypothetical protein
MNGAMLNMLIKQQHQNGLIQSANSSASFSKIPTLNSEHHHNVIHQPAGATIVTGATSASTASNFRLSSSNLDYQKWLLNMERQQMTNPRISKVEHQLPHQQQINNNPSSKPVNSKMSEVEKIKQELLGYQREIEMMQKQREYAKQLKQQQKEQELLKQQQQKNTNESVENKKSDQDSTTNNQHVNINGNHTDTSSNLNKTELDADRFEQNSKEIFDADNLAALHQIHHHQQQNNSNEIQIKSNQIHEAAIHSKPINYSSSNNSNNNINNQTNLKLNNGLNSNDVNNKLFNKNEINNVNNGNKKKEDENEIEDGECSRQEDDDEYEGQEYILETYETNNLKNKSSLIKKNNTNLDIHNKQQLDNIQVTNDDSIDVSNLINQYRSLPVGQDTVSTTASNTNNNNNNNSETIKIL